MWDEHERIRKGQYNSKTDHSPTLFSYLDLKLKIARELFGKCSFCEKRCSVDRNQEIGACGVGEALISSEFLHMGEEPILVPSHTIFFSGCNFDCVFCQNFDISQNPKQGILIKEEEMARKIDANRIRGSKNVNFVGGDPTPNLPYILRVMQQVQKSIPVVWNSNMYLSSETIKILDGFADLYLTDFKYGNDKCALRLSGVEDYMSIVGGNHILVQKSGDMIIRHLVLPNHVECCSIPLLDWIALNLGKDVVLNIMAQYHPLYQSHLYSDISCSVTRDEVEEVRRYAKALGFRNLIE